MKNKNLVIFIMVCILYPLFLFSESEKIEIRRQPNENILNASKSDTNNITPANEIQQEGLRVLPQQHYFDKRRAEYIPNRTSSNFNRLLAVMVEFQEDDNPQTTGNGKFNSEVEDYPITLASPPYNRQFFEAHLEAMKYYYRAVSFESYQLEYEVYPKNMQAYTLPQELGFYNPGVSSDIFIDRIEQYFQDVWTTVSESEDRPEFFGDFGHFMIIHAGSSWQHDRFGDTPQDMPSLFVNIADGKEVIVDGGMTMIKTSANVPERIWQDTRISTDSEGNRFATGYGVVNSVFAHEFGHSLGFADLYNTYNGRPAVGLFDIMDSGGSESVIAAADSEGIRYNIEGLFPALPSVWSRLIPFEQDFLERGILVDVNSIELSTELQIMNVSSRREINEEHIPYFYRIWLSETEYILIENRNIDPDGDGGTAMQSTLNSRVALHPTPIYSSGFTYEYDYLLPGFMDRYFDVHGGGLLIWHIDNDLIFNQGIFINGHFYSNYDRNRVNVGERGVKIIEADGIHDIGNPYAWFWTGTPYEYFFKYEPLIDSAGFFTGWSDKIHNTELSSATHPALRTNTGRPSSWKISNISESGRIMTFEISNSFFDITANLGSFNPLFAVSNIANISDDGLGHISVLSGQWGLRHFVSDEQFGQWLYIKDDRDLNVLSDFGIQTINIGIEDKQGFLLVHGNKINIIVGNDRFEHEFDRPIIQAPMSFVFQDRAFLTFVFENKSAIYELINSQNFVTELLPLLENIEEGKFFGVGNTIYLLSSVSNTLFKYDFNETGITSSNIGLPERFSNHIEPVVYNHNDKTVIYLMSDTRNMYTVVGDIVTSIFDLSRYTNESPSQFALGYAKKHASSFLMFHTETIVFVISEDGSFYPNFPQRMRATTLKYHKNPYIFDINGDLFFMLHDDNQGLLAIGFDGAIDNEKSQFFNKGDLDPQFFILNPNEDASFLYMLYSDRENNVISSVMSISNDSKILWNGFRNGSTGAFIQTSEINPEPIISNIEVFVYPNPVRQNVANVRILNSIAPANIRVFNIAGQLVLEQKLEEPVEDFRDFRFYAERFSSGTYFVIVEVEGQTFRDRFSIIK